MVRIPLWIIPIVVVLVIIAAATGAGGFTFQWTCDDYTKKKSEENIRDGYNPYDEYSFLGLGVGYCEPGYSDDEN